MNSEKSVLVSGIPIGGKHPIVIQSMVNTILSDKEKTLKQIELLKDEGCQLIRIAYSDRKFYNDFKYIIDNATMPVIADIHFDYKLAIEAIEAGASKIRINPGNIKKRNLVSIIKAAKTNKVPIRIGVNSGSLESELLMKYGHPVPEALVESAVNAVRFFENNDFDNIIISIKSSDVTFMYKANIILKEQIPYPIHLGVTEAGGIIRGTVKNSAGIASLLLNGVGDTIRISLSASPIEEIKIAKMLLKSLHLYENAPDIIACPTCSRTTFDVISMQSEIEKIFSRSDKNITIAIMGCVVNGPGEAKEADFGITGTTSQCILFKKGEIIFTGNKDAVLEKLYKEVEKNEKN